MLKVSNHVIIRVVKLFKAIIRWLLTIDALCSPMDISQIDGYYFNYFFFLSVQCLSHFIHNSRINTYWNIDIDMETS
jgi:hypothetical protein